MARSGGMKNSARMIDCLAASYRLDLGDADYVRNLANEAAPLLDRGLGIIAYAYDARDRTKPVIENFAVSGGFDPAWLKAYYKDLEARGYDGDPHTQPTGFAGWGHLTCEQASAVPSMRPYLKAFARIGGARDTFAVNALDASGRGLWLGAPMRSTRRVSAEMRTLFTRLAAHLTTAVRLRRAASVRRAAVMAPTGALLHAEDDSAVKVREDLRRATLAFERARTKQARRDVELATRRWRPLVASQWSLLDEFDTDGRRFVIAVDNRPPSRTPRGPLSEREHQVLTQAQLGHSNKEIAYELGLSHTTVRVLVHRAAIKLGVSTRAAAIARFEQLARTTTGE